MPELEASDIELSMPRPSYTINTLRRLTLERPADSFRLIMGADNWAGFPRWRESGEILRHYSPIVYPRPGFPSLKPAAGPGEWMPPCFRCRVPRCAAAWKRGNR